VRGGRALVPKPERDHGDIDAGLKEVHGRRVPDSVGGDRAPGELGMVLGSCLNRQSKALGHAGTRQLTARAVREQVVGPTRPGQLANPGSDNGSRRFPERNAAPLPPFFVEVRHRRHIENDIVNPQVDDLRHPRARIVENGE